MSGVPASSRGSTFNGGTIAPTADPGFEIDVPETAGTALAIRDTTLAVQMFSISPSGFIDAQGGTVTANTAQVGSTTVWKIQGTSDAGEVHDLLQVSNTSVPRRVRVIRSGHLLLDLANAAPADANVPASGVAFWLDDTDGVGNTKLMVKGKSADGTVKTAAILLT